MPSRARQAAHAPTRGAKSVQTLKTDEHPRCRYSTFRVFASYVNSPHIFVQYCLEMAGDHWSPALHLLHLQNQGCISCTLSLYTIVHSESKSAPSPSQKVLGIVKDLSQKILDRGSGQRSAHPRVPASGCCVTFHKDLADCFHLLGGNALGDEPRLCFVSLGVTLKGIELFPPLLEL